MGLGRGRRLVRISFATVACVLSVIFLSLGFWQLRRLGERKSQNAVLSVRRLDAPLHLAGVPADTGAVRFRRVSISGAYDYSREFALTLRSRNGSPGVEIITPLARAGTDTLVLVNRGWIYAPDGMTADLSKWPEGDSVNAIAFIETFPPPSRYAARSPRRSRAYRWLDRSAIEADLARPVAPYYVVLAPDPNARYSVPRPSAGTGRRAAEIPPRVEPRSLGEGPHKSYAIQWFSFAAISIFGLIFFLRRS